AKPGKRTLDFGIPPTAVSRLDLEVPDKDVRVEVLPKMAATTTSAEGETTRVLAFVGNSNHVTVTWMPPVETIKKGEALLTAAQQIHADLGERILRLNTTIAYTIERNEVDALS